MCSWLHCRVRWQKKSTSHGMLVGCKVLILRVELSARINSISFLLMYHNLVWRITAKTIIQWELKGTEPLHDIHINLAY